MPLQKKIVALELKINRVNEVLHQAINNLEFADISYAGFPMDVAKRVVEGKKKEKFSEKGIGILGVASQGCKVLLKPTSLKSNANKIMKAYCVERFWGGHSKEN